MLRRHKFVDLYEMSSGISTKPAQAGHGSPFVSFRTVFNNRFLPDELPDLMHTSAAEQETYSVRKGDILLTRTSETIDELGMSSVALKDYPGATFSGFAKRLRPRQEGVVDERFIGFYLRSALFRKTMTNNAVMTLRASLNEDIFSYLDLLLPDYKTQQRIGEVLFSLDAKIALNTRINAELESLAKLVYDYWFVQFDFPMSAAQAKRLGKPALAGKPYKSSGGPMVYNAELKREVPEGWEVGTLADLAEIIGGSTPSTARSDFFMKNGTAWITPKDLSNNVGNRYITRGETDVSPLGIASTSLKVMPAGTVLLSTRAPIGYMAIAREAVTTNQGFKSFVPNKGYSTEFIFETVRSCMPAIIRQSAGTTFQEVSKSALSDLKVCLPPTSLVEDFTKMVSPMFRQQNVLELQKLELAALREWLLPLLMNGQVRVAEAEDKVGLAMAAEGQVGYGKNKRSTDR